MEYITHNTESTGMAQILCCQCGMLIEPNPSSTCVNCLRGRIDIAAEIPKQAVIFSCRGCQRYLNPPDEWVYCELESRELLKLCLKKLKGMDRVRTTHAEFSWTEPHSKRIKVVVTVQKTLQCGTVLEQKFTVEFTVHHQMCNDCHRTEANNIWSAMVQVRQHGNNRKTFYYLEQLLIKHNTFKTVGYKPTNAGVDFQFATDSHARKLVDFIQSMLPVRTQHSKKLISHDIHSNVYNYKFTYGVEIVPLSKDSLVCLPKKLTQQLGSISSICLVHRVTSTVHLIDNNTGQVCDLSATVYFRNPFASICYPKELIEYIVMDIEILKENEKRSFPGQGAVSNKHVVADAWVVKACELGINDNPVHTRTHLGHILKPGDSVLGYNIADSNVNDVNFDKLDRDAVPDVFLVKKHYGGKAARRRARAWKLRHMGDAGQGVGARPGRDSANRDYDDFLDDLEEDPVLRQNVNIYKDADKLAVDTDDEADPSMPRITLAEMLDDLDIEDAEMNEV